MFQIETTEILKAALIFLRIGGIIFFLPMFGDRSTPIKARILIAGALSVLFYHLVPNQWLNQQVFTTVGLVIIVVKELFIGFTIGFIAKIAFDGILMASSLVGYQMGFGMANLLVPDAGQQMNAFTALHRIIILLIFLGLNLHHIFISGIAESFTYIPLGQVAMNGEIASMIIGLTANIFSIAVQLAAPILVALMFTMAALGLIARTVPQMNVFTFSFPASFFVGLTVYVATFPFFPEWMKTHFQNTHTQIILALKGLSL